MRKWLFFSCICIMQFAVFAKPVKAETHTHDWYVCNRDFNSVSDTEHEIVETYLCAGDCDETKTETYRVPHIIKVDNTLFNGFYNISDTQHARTMHYYCVDCGYKTSETETADHIWDITGVQTCKEISDTQHEYTTHYKCYKCGAKKTETVKKDHDWKIIKESDYTSISGKQHSYKSLNVCICCQAKKEDTIKADHTFDPYGECTLCGYQKKSTINLKPGQFVKVNPYTWCKITVKKNGCLIVKSNTEDAEADLYNKSRKVFPASSVHCSFRNNYTDYIPVVKGVYYLKGTKKEAFSYTFKADPSKKNYSPEKAVNMKKNKLYTTVIYPSKKKLTWKRYYKIILKQKGKIRISADSSDVRWIYNSKGKRFARFVTRYNKKGEASGLITDNKLPKGTYYIIFRENWGDTTRKYTAGSYYTVRWK